MLLMFAENTFQECPDVFWSQVDDVLTDLLEVFTPCLLRIPLHYHF